MPLDPLPAHVTATCDLHGPDCFGLLELEDGFTYYLPAASAAEALREHEWELLADGRVACVVCRGRDGYQPHPDFVPSPAPSTTTEEGRTGV